MKHIYQEPSLEHLNAKILVWLLSCVLVGITVCMMLPDFDDDKMIRQAQRVRIVSPRNASRRRSAEREMEEENCLIH
jgi:hypothetical protein